MSKQINCNKNDIDKIYKIKEHFDDTGFGFRRDRFRRDLNQDYAMDIYKSCFGIDVDLAQFDQVQVVHHQGHIRTPLFFLDDKILERNNKSAQPRL